MPGRTRREVLAALAASAATPALETNALRAQTHDMSQMVPVSGLGAAAPYKPKVLTAAEMTWLNPLVDAIIPRTDTPGASDAGVPAAIDRRVATSATLATQLRRGMAALDAEATRRYQKNFAALDGAQATELLASLESAPQSELGQFFKTVKDLTIDGYYSSQQGLAQELGWHGNTYLAEFKGCTHPEHQS